LAATAATFAKAAGLLAASSARLFLSSVLPAILSPAISWP
jgi:hypothetical protein